GRQHRLLQGVGGVLGVAAGEPGQPVQLPVVAVEQLLEGIAVTVDMCGQQLRVGPRPAIVPEALHSRTVSGAGARPRHLFAGTRVWRGQRRCGLWITGLWITRVWVRPPGSGTLTHRGRAG